MAVMKAEIGTTVATKWANGSQPQPRLSEGIVRAEVAGVIVERRCGSSGSNTNIAELTTVEVLKVEVW